MSSICNTPSSDGLKPLADVLDALNLRLQTLGTGLRVDSFSGALNQRCNGAWLRHINRVTARNLDDCRTRALGHETLGRRWNHLVVGNDQIPTWLGPPCRLTDRATERFDAPGNLRVSHEGGLFRIHVGRERGGELCLVEKQEAVLRWQYRRYGSARWGILKERRHRLAVVQSKV